MYRIRKYGAWLFIVIKKDTGLALRDSNDKLITFKRKTDAVDFCKSNNYELE